MMNDTSNNIYFQKRLQEIFLSTSNPEVFSDQELLEFLIPLVSAEKDVSGLAKKLLDEFGNIGNLINADKKDLCRISQDDSMHFVCLLVRELIRRMLKHKITNQSLINNYNALVQYLKTTMGCLRVEQFRVLFLNTKNILLADELMAVGTIDQISVYPREVIKRALANEASAIILVHNHPSGDTKPSKADSELTNKIEGACKLINIKLHDHIIISNNEYYSFNESAALQTKKVVEFQN